MAAPAKALAVAVLGRADAARQSLRRALEDLGANVVFEGDPAGTKPEQVLKAAPAVVLVNLASGVEDDIDHLDALFDSPEVNVVFNEADVSSQLEGWDLARWARHLAAKITGQDDTIPPPPPGAEPLSVRNFMPVPGAPPTPAQLTPERPIEEFMIEAEDRVEGVPSDHLPFASPRRTPAEEEPAPDFRIDASEIEGALAQIGGPPPAVEQRAVPEAEVPEIVVHEDEAAEFDAGLDLAALDAALELEQTPAPKPSKSDAALLDEALSGLNMDLVDDSTLSSDDGDLDLSYEADGESVSFGSVSLTDDGSGLDLGEGSGELDADVAALAAQLDALEASTARGEVRDMTFDVESTPAAAPKPGAPAAHATKVAPAAAAPAPAAAPVAKKPSFGNLDLSPMDDDVAAPAPAAAAAKPSYDFSGLSGLSLEAIDDDASAPAPTPAPAKPQAAAKSYDFGDLNLSLEPVEGEEAPSAPAASAPAAAPADDLGLPSIDALFAAMDLAPVAAKSTGATSAASSKAIPRIIVLGASIGGPDAVRTFIAGIPEGFPALFLLVQHLENGFFERLAQQLQKSAKLPVRVPDGATPARRGEILVIPAQQRVQIETDGEVVLTQHATPPKYTPCIDQVLRDVADRFGSDATAIIFSGMAGDAIEGAVYLTGLGGEVWAQDPASCIVSSMVDGARARGVVEFLGSPRELAERCVEKYGRL